ncbi:MAG: aminoacyl-histidine dipeptidase [Ignavibacteria bacterium]|jgi:dipeptidase D|nr:aminoacyl-histidine dipeptidase [Ignavibacteria bacterium]
MSNPLSNLEPKSVFHWFGELEKYPRPSKKETKAVAFIEKWASEHHIALRKDKRGNLLLSKPATQGMQNKQSVCLQGHIDMVCVAEKGHKIDFDKDPIDVYVDGDWIKARGTTLGGDDGIAVAMGMALLASTDIAHPDLELLLTLDEETGLTGASGLGTDLIKSKLLINIDSEDEGIFTIGCAGGMNTIAHYPYERRIVPQNNVGFILEVTGLKGGHSGIEINAGRANANKILTRLLWVATEKFKVFLQSFDGGSKHNAIPSEARAILAVPTRKVDGLKKYVETMNDIIKKEYAVVEPDLRIHLTTTAVPKYALSKTIQKKMLASFCVVPHGVLRMSANPDTKELVQSSTNFAIVETISDKEIMVLTSQRSSVGTEKLDIVEMVKTAFLLGGAKVETTDGYPAWEPRDKSPLQDLVKSVYKKVSGKEAIIDTIHAGLECGLIGDKYEGMDMISIGPDLKDVHSPDEKLSISSTKRTWEFLVELLKHIPNK